MLVRGQDQPQAVDDNVKPVDVKPVAAKGLSSSILGSSEILTKIKLKKKCKEIFVADFDAKWDCIRSGTSPREFPCWFFYIKFKIRSSKKLFPKPYFSLASDATSTSTAPGSTGSTIVAVTTTAAQSKCF